MQPLKGNQIIDHCLAWPHVQRNVTEHDIHDNHASVHTYLFAEKPDRSRLNMPVKLPTQGLDPFKKAFEHFK